MLLLRHCRRLNRFSLLCAALIALSGCGGDDPSSPDTTAFDLSVLIQGLRDQGATVESIGFIAQPFFSATGQILRVNGEDVQAFEYATEADARAEAARVSPDGFTIEPPWSVGWQHPISSSREASSPSTLETTKPYSSRSGRSWRYVSTTLRHSRAAFSEPRLASGGSWRRCGPHLHRSRSRFVEQKKGVPQVWTPPREWLVRHSGASFSPSAG